MPEPEAAAPVDDLALPPTSVGIFCYNQKRFVGDCLSSVLTQTPPPTHVYVVDDGSADGTLEHAREVSATLPHADRVTFLADGANKGLPARMNEVLATTPDPYVVWVASDDMLADDGLRVLREAAAAHSDTDVAFGDLAVMDEDTTPRNYNRPADTWQGAVARRYASGGHPFQDLLRFNNFVPGGMSLIRTEALRSVGGYEEHVRTEDMNMWLTLGRDRVFRYVGRPVGRYRVVAGSESRQERIGVLDHAALLRRRTEGDPAARRLAARLVALRWALSIARTRGRPPVPLGELAKTAGMRPADILRALPTALWAPVSGAARSRLARATHHATPTR